MRPAARLALPGLMAALAALAACGASDPATGGRQAALPPLHTLQVAPGEAGGISWDGVVQAQEQAMLSAQTGGRVASLAADVDARVARGAQLLRLTAHEQQAAVDTAAAQLRAAEAQQADAAARFQRASELLQRQLIARDDFDRVRAAHEAAAAARDAAAALLAQARQQLAYTRVDAPYAGIIATRHVELGETVVPGQPLFTLYAPSRLRVEVQLPQAQAAAVRGHPEALLWLPDGRRIAPQSVIVYPAADPGAHSTTVRLLLPALDDAPRPGQTVKVHFAATAGSQGIWLPDYAIVQRGELAAAYVVRDGQILLRQLRLGRSRDGQYEVIAGLAAGEQVAADPAAALQALRTLRGQAGSP